MTESKINRPNIRIGLTIVGCLIIGAIVGRSSVATKAISKVNDVTTTKQASSGKLPENLDYSGVEKVYDTLRSKYDGELDAAKLEEGLKEGLAASVGDPYTEYFSPEKNDQFQKDLNGKFSGIGAELTKDGELVIVQSPISGAPAEKAGLKAKDAIVEIDGESAVNISVDAAVKKIRGESGTKVKLVVLRAKSQRIDFEITREEITIPSVVAKVENNIGYLQISRFAQDTGALAEKAANEFASKKVSAVVLDMRNNPGGYVDAAVSVAGLWIESGGVVVQEKRADGSISSTEVSRGKAQLKSIKTIILINEGSASASEIVAGALKDSVNATLVGKKSFGKGVVQSIEPIGGSKLLGNLGEEGSLKVTVAKWYTPKGVNIHKEGIKVDIDVEVTVEDAKAGLDKQLDRAKELAK
jgi:carboxyl-terminal processing protease